MKKKKKINNFSLKSRKYFYILLTSIYFEYFKKSYCPFHILYLQLSCFLSRISGNCSGYSLFSSLASCEATYALLPTFRLPNKHDRNTVISMIIYVKDSAYLFSGEIITPTLWFVSLSIIFTPLGTKLFSNSCVRTFLWEVRKR